MEYTVYDSDPVWEQLLQFNPVSFYLWDLTCNVSNFLSLWPFQQLWFNGSTIVSHSNETVWRCTVHSTCLWKLSAHFIINVSYVFSYTSGIGTPSTNPHIWYRRRALQTRSMDFLRAVGRCGVPTRAGQAHRRRCWDILAHNYPLSIIHSSHVYIGLSCW